MTESRRESSLEMVSKGVDLGRKGLGEATEMADGMLGREDKAGLYEGGQEEVEGVDIGER